MLAHLLFELRCDLLLFWRGLLNLGHPQRACACARERACLCYCLWTNIPWLYFHGFGRVAAHDVFAPFHTTQETQVCDACREVEIPTHRMSTSWILEVQGLESSPTGMTIPGQDSPVFPQNGGLSPLLLLAMGKHTRGLWYQWKKTGVWTGTCNSFLNPV